MTTAMLRLPMAAMSQPAAPAVSAVRNECAGRSHGIASNSQNPINGLSRFQYMV